MIKGLNHITISVKDLSKSFHFYSEVLGFKPLMRHPRGAYLLAGDVWFCLDLDSKTRTAPSPEYTHFAFSVEQADFEKIKNRIQNANTPSWKDNKSEGDSFYFLDPDGHKLEVHVGNWETRINSYKARKDLVGYEFFI